MPLCTPTLIAHRSADAPEGLADGDEREPANAHDPCRGIIFTVQVFDRCSRLSILTRPITRPGAYMRCHAWRSGVQRQAKSERMRLNPED